ncbi:MAG TPA: DUF4259 domain-containing protein [Phycisphaerales bacterium]|nr:DUF4259 domain-containing protein [Phycisphaerales bacterium]
MGTWGVNAFENDTALDWVWELEESEDLSVVVAALEGPLADDADEYLEAPVCEMALAAAEIVAALKGHPPEKLPREADDWVKRNRGRLKVDQELIETAHDAIARVVADSELRELWDESEELAAWEKALESLQKRLNS